MQAAVQYGQSAGIRAQNQRMMFELPDVDEYPLLYLAAILPTSVSVLSSADGGDKTKN